MGFWQKLRRRNELFFWNTWIRNGITCNFTLGQIVLSNISNALIPIARIDQILGPFTTSNISPKINLARMFRLTKLGQNQRFVFYGRKFRESRKSLKLKIFRQFLGPFYFSNISPKFNHARMFKLTKIGKNPDLSFYNRKFPEFYKSLKLKFFRQFLKKWFQNNSRKWHQNADF